MIKIKNIKRVIFTVLALYTALTFLLPCITFAYDIPKDKNYPAYGIPTTYWPLQNYQKTCGNVYFLLNEISDGRINSTDNEIIHYKNLYNAQCLGLTVTEHTVYERPYDRSAKTSKDRSCEEYQETLISQLFEKEWEEKDLDAQDKMVYIKECVTPPTDWVPRNIPDEDRGIPLMAPFPVEGGDYIENTNKTYIFTYMIKLYKFVIGIAGIVAVGELVLAGYGIALAAGDSGKVENSKKRLIQTLEGLGLLFTTAIILNTINPQAYNFDADVKITKTYVGEFVYSAGMGNWADSSYETATAGQEVLTYCTELDEYFGISVDPLNDNVERLKKIQAIDEATPGKFLTIDFDSSVTKEKIAALITKGPLNDRSTTAFPLMVSEGEKYNINPMLAVYMWKTESGWGVPNPKSVAARTYNIGNVRPTKTWRQNNWPIDKGIAGEFMDFHKHYGEDGWIKGIPFWFEFISEVYTKQDFDTVEEIIAKYAPCTETRSKGNNTKKYIFDVRSQIEAS